MDILIKNMEMPKNCGDCHLPCYCGAYCVVVEKAFRMRSQEKSLRDCFEELGKPFDCPLVEIPVPTPIGYKTEADVLLKLWMDKIITDGEYNKIMERLNKAVVLERTT